MAEEPAREQGSQEQPPARLCSSLELIQADLTSSKHLDVLPQGHLLPGRQGMELSFLQQESEGQPALSPPQGPAWELCSTILLRSIFITEVGGEHLDSISSWLDSSSQHLLSKSLHKLLSHSIFPSLLLPTAGFTPPWGVPPCRPPELAVTLEFRPGQCPEVTLLSVLISTCCKGPHPGKGHREECRAPELHSPLQGYGVQSAPRSQGCSPGEEMGLQVRRGRVTRTREVMGDARPPG